MFLQEKRAAGAANGRTMNYLAVEEYESYGIEASTPASWVAAASSLIDAHCRRATLAATQYTERLRLTPGRNSVQLTYLPLCTPSEQNSPIVSAKARYATPRKGDCLTTWDMAQDVAMAFALPGAWVDIDASRMDCFADTGEVSWLANPLGLQFQEIEIQYSAGFDTIPDPIKFACAQIVRNAQATPALNVRASTLNSMHLEYFADTLVDTSVRAMLAPYVAQKVG
jgi:hypothetical protein